ncbi:prenyltransferase [Thalassotalea montiporae]
MEQVKAAFMTMRPPFLLLTPICIGLAASMAMDHGYGINILVLSLIFSCALLAHIAVNTLNEYLDFQSGLDLATKRTPFSGGSGALVATPSAANWARNIAITCIVLIVLIGGYLCVTRTWLLLPLGLIGLAVVIQYTRTLNTLPWLCFISPGVGFSLIITLGSFLALTYTITLDALLIAGITFFQINNLLLLNQFPDTEADAAHGRNTLPIHYGATIATVILLVSTLSSFALIAVLIQFKILPLNAYWALVTMPLAIVSCIGAFIYGFEIGKRPAYLACNVIVALVTPTILAISLL